MDKEEERNLLRHDGVPSVFSNRALAQEITEGLRLETMTLGELELRKLQRISHVLEHPELSIMIDEGKITLGMIKPQANQGRNLPFDDQEAANALLKEIGEENVIFSFSTCFSEENINDFYSTIKAGYFNQPSEKPGKKVWELIFEFSKSGPLTFILLYCEQGNAVSWWRNKMGKTKASEADPDSIRGRHAILENLPNNLVHGSDSIESVHREVNVLRQITRELVRKAADTKRLMLEEKTIRQLGIVPPEAEILTLKRIFDSGRRSESWIYGWEAIVYHPNEGIKRKYVKQKNLISFGGAIEVKTEKEYKRMEAIEKLDIPQLRRYGFIRGGIYQEYIVNDKTEDTLRQLGQNALTEENQTWLDQLISIAKKLDQAGYAPLNFMADLIFDGDKGQFFYNDFGSDLGDPGDQPTHYAKNQLLQHFPRHQEYIKHSF